MGCPVPGRGESDGWARSGHGPSEHGQLEPLVAEHGAWGVGVFELEAVDRHPLLCPAPSLDADVARRDVPATVVHGHAECLSLTCHGNGGEHHDESGVAQSVVHPAVAEHGVLHLDDERVVGDFEGFIPVGERDLMAIDGQSLPLSDDSCDCALSTWTLCTIPDVAMALAEVRRVLKPGGTLHFVEHGLAADENVQRWQHRLEPIQKRVFGGCHLTRPIADLLTAAGFTITEVDVFYENGAPKTLGADSLDIAVSA